MVCKSLAKFVVCSISCTQIDSKQHGQDDEVMALPTVGLILFFVSRDIAR